EHVEVVRPHVAVARAVIGVGLLPESLDRHAPAPVVASEQRNGGRRNASHAGKRRERLLDAVVQRHGASAVVPAATGRDADLYDLVDVDAEIDAADVPEA